MEDKDISVEVGPGSVPLLPALRKDLRTSNMAYLERDPRALKDLKEKRWQIYLEAEEGERKVFQGDVTAMPFADSSIASLLIKDVFGQEGLYKLDRGIMTEVKVGDFNKIAQESYRVIKDGGKVVVIEATGTGPKVEELIEVFEKAGFKIKDEERYLGRQEIAKLFDDKVVSYSIAATSYRDSYGLIFRKERD